MLSGHHIREGPQWDMCRQVSDLCRLHYRNWCSVQDHVVPDDQFLLLMWHQAFVICVKGGGIDPSPKAWQAILQGANPIIRSSALDSACRQLPVAIIDAWDPKSLMPERLQK